ncbi:hypothetical protein HMPREF1624_03872 [Sporothrix schenckii ATCC 58251]|uniref:Nitrate reductase [NADPH] n=1 Tax=Sporothrix schenckii (strain ATCC 58251 / de Perez 2211183) TaxID=1391915 RepID=U7PXY5_SPOS1|nr:hypothetical protein HMPREF1624_03872 [Sporothrix schenckii ATCC 58251]
MHPGGYSRLESCQPYGKFTLYAGVSLVSVLLALSQPLSLVHIGHHDEHDSGHTHDGSKDINTSDAPPPPPPSTSGDQRDPSLPRFRLADVRKHDANSGSPWVTSGDKVYDITDWVAAHPGGDVILRAAGHSIDPYWAIFTIHKAPHVREILDSYLIGFVDMLDLDTSGQPKIAAGEAVEDPFADDPTRDKRLVVLTQKPCNAEPAPPQLARDFATPNELFYVRNHMWVPVVEGAEADQHKLTVELPDGDVRAYTLDELRTRFQPHKVTAVLQCSGNRRSDMTRAVGKTNGLQWGTGAISNAVWEGVLLRDVLADAGLRAARIDGRPKEEHKNNNDNDDDDVPPDGLHVQLTGMEAYAASIPLPTALDPRGEVLLAYAMNGEPLPRDHGYPLRAIVPGFVAARSVKWLSKIVVSDEESPSQWQRRDYKLFGPNEGAAPDWDRYPAIQEMPVTSAITGVWVGQSAINKAIKDGSLPQRETPTLSPGLGSRAAPGVRDLAAWQAEWKQQHASPKDKDATPVTATGYAYSGGGREIVRVDVSVDGGRTWDQATLLDQKQAHYDDETDRQKGNIVARGRRDFAWKRWRYDGLLLGGDASPAEVVVKATDNAYNTQPERHDGIYNVRGNLATAWHRVAIERNGRKDAVLHGCGFDKECKK